MNHTIAIGDTHAAEMSEQIGRCETSYDVLRFARELTRRWGYDFFMIVHLPKPEDRLLSAVSIVSNWPPELVATYDQLGLLRSSPMMDALKKSTKPFVWSIPDLYGDHSGENGSLVAELFRTFGFENGVCFSAQHASGRRGSVIFAGKRDAPNSAELMEQSYVANLIYDQVNAITDPSQPATQPLSARENECLVWTSEGKTSAEIATILGLSEHTVNHYLSAACQKLGAINRAHAVAIAIRSGLLD